MRDLVPGAARYALAPICIGAAVLLQLSPASDLIHPTGFFLLGVVAVAWVGGVAPSVLAALLAALALPQLITMSSPLLWGFFDLPRFITLGLTGAAVGWGTSAHRRAEAA